jgi:hypothetical protein
MMQDYFILEFNKKGHTMAQKIKKFAFATLIFGAWAALTETGLLNPLTNFLGKTFALDVWDQYFGSLFVALATSALLYQIVSVSWKAWKSKATEAAEPAAAAAEIEKKAKKRKRGILNRINVTFTDFIESYHSKESSINKKPLFSGLIHPIHLPPKFFAKEGNKSPVVSLIALGLGILTFQQLHQYLITGHSNWFVQGNLYLINHVLINLSQSPLSNLIIFFQALMIMQLTLLAYNNRNMLSKETEKADQTLLDPELLSDSEHNHDKIDSETPEETVNLRAMTGAMLYNKNAIKTITAVSALTLFIAPFTLYHNQPLITAALLTLTILFAQIMKLSKKVVDSNGQKQVPKTAWNDFKDNVYNTVFAATMLFGILGSHASHVEELGLWVCFSAILLALKPILLFKDTFNKDKSVILLFFGGMSEFLKQHVADEQSKPKKIFNLLIKGPALLALSVLQAAMQITLTWGVLMPLQFLEVMAQGAYKAYHFIVKFFQEMYSGANEKHARTEAEKHAEEKRRAMHAGFISIFFGEADKSKTNAGALNESEEEKATEEKTEPAPQAPQAPNKKIAITMVANIALLSLSAYFTSVGAMALWASIASIAISSTLLICNTLYGASFSIDQKAFDVPAAATAADHHAPNELAAADADADADAANAANAANDDDTDDDGELAPAAAPARSSNED